MSTPFLKQLEAKKLIFNRIYDMFLIIQPTLDKCDIKKYVDKKDLLLIVEEETVNRYKDGEAWFKKLLLEVAEWKRLRRENTEVVWATYVDNDMTSHKEYVEMERLTKNIKDLWKDRHNPLLRPKDDE